MPSNADPEFYTRTLMAIAQDIEALGPDYSQLSEFSAETHCDLSALTIGYAYKTHAPEPRPGWAGGVPSPDADGVWFLIDFHPSDSTSQIHTQPLMEPLWIHQLEVSFLMRQGSDTRNLYPALQEILDRHGVRGER
jgi:hypothetical protein